MIYLIESTKKSWGKSKYFMFSDRTETSELHDAAQKIESSKYYHSRIPYYEMIFSKADQALANGAVFAPHVLIDDFTKANRMKKDDVVYSGAVHNG
jgi:hypothetical protein